MGSSVFLIKKKSYHLHPGEIFISKEDMVINTVLGSCVAVCLWDSKRQIGGMNHVMLPVNPDDQPISTRYGNVATYVLYDMLREEGCYPRFIQAKIFGGANGMAKYGFKGGVNVGDRNIEITLKVLGKLKLEITGRDIGGHTGRKIQFDVRTGKIVHNYLGQFNFEKELNEIKA
ncbi:MAG: chemotaxis protein CheD [Deltaproteobacteria bacterium]|nr:chemotaxis protein CheD [Deltaproteobacteria bacterium]